jgi:alpha-beta hydrolase superfamily lysophospholipase
MTPGTRTLGATILAALLLAAVDATAQAVPDLAREKRHADEIVPSLVVGDAVWLTTTSGRRFLGLMTEVPQPKGAVILVHGPGWHPDHGLTGELRMALADRGYVTLSLQMPVLAASEEDGAKYRDLFPEADERIAAGVRLLRDRGFARVAIVSHAMGSGMTYHWLQRSPRAPLFAWVALSVFTAAWTTTSRRSDSRSSTCTAPRTTAASAGPHGAASACSITSPARSRSEVADGGWFLAGGTRRC